MPAPSKFYQSWRAVTARCFYSMVGEDQWPANGPSTATSSDCCIWEQRQALRVQGQVRHVKSPNVFTKFVWMLPEGLASARLWQVECVAPARVKTLCHEFLLLPLALPVDIPCTSFAHPLLISSSSHLLIRSSAHARPVPYDIVFSKFQFQLPPQWFNLARHLMAATPAWLRRLLRPAGRPAWPPDYDYSTIDKLSSTCLVITRYKWPKLTVPFDS